MSNLLTELDRMATSLEGIGCLDTLLDTLGVLNTSLLRPPPDPNPNPNRNPNRNPNPDPNPNPNPCPNRNRNPNRNPNPNR